MPKQKNKPSFMGVNISNSPKMNARVTQVCKATGCWSEFEVRMILSSKKGFWESRGFKNTLTNLKAETVQDWKKILKRQNSCSPEFELCIRQIDKLLRPKKVLKLRVIRNESLGPTTEIAAFA